MKPPEIFETDKHRIACDGGGAAFGHPRVWLEMGDKKAVDCPYCGRRFVLKADAAAGH